MKNLQKQNTKSKLTFFHLTNSGLKILGIFLLFFPLNKLRNKWNRLLVFPSFVDLLLTPFSNTKCISALITEIRRNKSHKEKGKNSDNTKLFPIFLYFYCLWPMWIVAYLLSIQRRFIWKRRESPKSGDSIFFFRYFLWHLSLWIYVILNIPEMTFKRR